ncbi:MAG: class II aldolase [Clostridiales bacterium]|nr:class II aldolase [Clostridiales bacterium]
MLDFKLDQLIKMSNIFGSDRELVLAGGGNTSFKSDGVLYVKASGSSLASADRNSFVKMDRVQLIKNLGKDYPKEDRAREEASLSDLMAARLPGENKRPSVETALHALFPQAFVLHLHPALVNGLTCGKRGKEAADRLFGHNYLWVEAGKPGHLLAKLCQGHMQDYKRKNFKDAGFLLLQNHGVFFAADSVSQLETLLNLCMEKLEKEIMETPTTGPEKKPPAETEKLIETVRASLDPSDHLVFSSNNLTARFTYDFSSAKVLMQPFTPDHIVYCGAKPLFLSRAAEFEKDQEAFFGKEGYRAKIIILEKHGFIALGKTEKEALTARDVFLDAMKIAVYSQSFGGPSHMTAELTDFIINWEVEKYRQKQNY